MTLNRDLWDRDEVDINDLPDWLCPHCARPRLQYDGNGLIGTTGQGAFKLECSGCGGTVVVSGLISRENNLLQPKSFLPTIDIFPLSSRCPPDILVQTQLAFSLYWIDLNAAGNRIRTSVELIMNHLKVKKTTLTKAGKRNAMSLHDRILEYYPKNPEVGDLLLAIKWIGNIGSHGSELQKIDLLDDFDMLEEVHEKLFVQDRLRLKERVKKINISKGMIRR